MAIHVTQLGKHKFACGLFWQSLSRPRDLLKEAAELAKRIDADLLVLRRDHTTAQAGFANSKDGVRASVFSLGAAVSKTVAIEGLNYDGQVQPVHNWLGAFKLPDGKWAYFAVRDANFLPNGDFAGTKEEVLDRLHGDYGLGGWNVVLGAPELEEQGFHNFIAKNIEELIPHKKNGQIKAHQWWMLRSMKRELPWRLMAVAGAALLFLAAAYYYTIVVQRARFEEQRRRQMEAAQQALRQSQLPVAHHPWADIPSPASFAHTCTENLRYLTAGGWQLENYACEPSRASYSWMRGDSNIGLLLADVPAAVIDLSGNKASLVTPLKVTSGKENDDSLLDERRVVDTFVSRLQSIDINPKIARAPAPRPPAPVATSGPAVPPPKPEWEMLNFSMNVGVLPPKEIASIIGQPGIRVNKMVFHGGEWTLEGVIYAKNL
jgi:hypothetical protein